MLYREAILEERISRALRRFQQELNVSLAAHILDERHDDQPALEVDPGSTGWVRWIFPRVLLSDIRCEVPEWVKRLHLYLQYFLSIIGLAEEDIPKNHRRFRWTNRHGRKLYDDYVIHEPGALQALQEYLDTTTAPVMPNNAGFAGSQDHIFNATTTCNPYLLPRSTDIAPSIDITDQPGHPFRDFQIDMTGQAIDYPVSVTGPLWLLICIDRSGRPVKLYQENITHVTNDRELFHFLRGYTTTTEEVSDRYGHYEHCTVSSL
ncbi:hypothetical protein BDV06DRAFT_170096 [Aspergillus oleicola]